MCVEFFEMLLLFYPLSSDWLYPPAVTQAWHLGMTLVFLVPLSSCPSFTCPVNIPRISTSCPPCPSSGPSHLPQGLLLQPASRSGFSPFAFSHPSSMLEPPGCLLNTNMIMPLLWLKIFLKVTTFRIKFRFFVRALESTPPLSSTFHSLCTHAYAHTHTVGKLKPHWVAFTLQEGSTSLLIPETSPASLSLFLLPPHSYHNLRLLGLPLCFYPTLEVTAPCN